MKLWSTNESGISGCYRDVTRFITQEQYDSNKEYWKKESEKEPIGIITSKEQIILESNNDKEGPNKYQIYISKEDKEPFDDLYYRKWEKNEETGEIISSNGKKILTSIDQNRGTIKFTKSGKSFKTDSDQDTINKMGTITL